jgi:hypothetical protein
MDVKGTDAGLFDEMGSVYVNDIKYEYPISEWQKGKE